MKALQAEDVNLDHFPLVAVTYPPKEIHTVGLQVTPENIGQLALEFEAELQYAVNGNPYFMIIALRDKENGQWTSAYSLTIKLSYWIVALRGEIHTYQDYIFRNTFTGVNDEIPPNMEGSRPDWDRDNAYNETLRVVGREDVKDILRNETWVREEEEIQTFMDERLKSLPNEQDEQIEFMKARGILDVPPLPNATEPNPKFTESGLYVEPRPTTGDPNLDALREKLVKPRPRFNVGDTVLMGETRQTADVEEILSWNAEEQQFYYSVSNEYGVFHVGELELADPKSFR